MQSLRLKLHCVSMTNDLASRPMSQVPCRFKNERFDDRSMEADWKSIQAEERRSAKMGRSEDEKAELEELARQKAKAAAKAAHKSKKSKTSFPFV